MDKCCKLVRVSSDAQDERNQDAETDRHIETHGYEVAREVRLHDISAFKGEQAADLESVLNDIRAGKYTVVVVAHSSRIDRRDPDVAMLWTLQVRMAGGRVESVREPEYGRSDLGGRIMTMLAQESNHAYSKAIGDNVRAAQARSRANGAFTSGAIPFGFQITGERYEKRLEPTEDGLRIIPEVYDRVTRGHSLGAVAAWATTELGRNVWPATVGDWVRNPVYKGYLCKRVENKGKHTFGKVLHEVPAIVTVPVWSAANAAMDSRKATVFARKGGLLTGVLNCGQCGAKMYKIKTASYWGYYCKKTPVGGGCGNFVKKEVVDRLAVEKVSKLFFKVSKPVMIPGMNNESEIHAVLMQIQGLNLRDKDDRAKQAELLDELDRLENLETTPDRIEMVESEQTIGDEFAAIPEDDRNAWLREHEIKFTALNTKKFPALDNTDIPMESFRSWAGADGVRVTVTTPLVSVLQPGY
jgi:DNA invertase Pin-like site-specific DNA recombinase